MNRSKRGVIVGGLVLVLGLFFMARGAGAADDEVPKEVKDGINKIADLIGAGKMDEAKKAAAALAKKAGCDGGKPGSCEGVMHVFSARKRGGFGVGDKSRGTNDGIELMVQFLADDNKKLTDKALATDREAFHRMALIAAAIGDVTIAATPKKDAGKKKAADWKKWAEEMRDGAGKLAAETEKKNATVKAVKQAARGLDGSCTSCHQVFKP
jgi:hypothetical protein